MSPIAIDTPANGHTTHKPTTAFHQTTSDLSKNPLERTWRGDKEGALKIEAYPSFMHATDPAGLLEKRQWVKEHLAIAFRFWGKMGYGEGISGHITVRDPILRDHFWMNPFGVHFSSMSVSKLVLVTPEGYVHPTLGAQRPINVSSLRSGRRADGIDGWILYSFGYPSCSARGRGCGSLPFAPWESLVNLWSACRDYYPGQLSLLR
jgi:hypothetical protein